MIKKTKIKNDLSIDKKNQNKLIQFQYIQILSDTNKDVDAWYNQMKAWIIIYQITDEEEILIIVNLKWLVKVSIVLMH